MISLTEKEVAALHERLLDQIGTFGYTQDVTPANWLALERQAVAEVREIVLRFEAEKEEK